MRLNHFMSRAICVAFFCAGVCSLRAAEETTQSAVTKFGDKLSGLWTAHPQEKDALIRKEKALALVNSFNTDLKGLDAPVNITTQKVFTNYMNGLEKARTLFRLEKMNTERASYISAVGQVFRKELAQASDIGTERVAGKVFDQLMSWTDDVKNRIRSIPDDAHAAVFTSLTEAFNLMMRSATKDAGEPTATYEQEIKEIQRRFPVSTPALQKFNQPAKSMLESAAKSVLDFNKK